MKQYIRTNPHHSLLYFIGAGLIILTFVIGFLSWTTSASLFAGLRTDSAYASSALVAASTASTAAASSQSVSPSKTDTTKQTAPPAAATGKSAATGTNTTAPKSTTTGVPATTLPTGASAAGKQLYVSPGRDYMPAAISSQPVGIWLTDAYGIQNKVSSIVSQAAAKGTVPTLVAYNIPGRDCNQYSSGGASGSDAYKAWIRSVAAGIGSRDAIVILEPDALAGIDCLSPAMQADRYALLADAVSVLATTKASVYLDGGNSGWIGASTMAARLTRANIAGASGFALNVSNFYTTSQNTSYGRQISAQVGGKHFIIDTSRNGNGSAGGENWCNPSGRALGTNPTTSVGGLVDAYLWVKVPGESDGSCHGDPAAGQWFDSYANALVANRQ